MSKLVINDKLTIPWNELTFRSVTSRGPGGQNVNRVNSRALLRWNYEESDALSWEIKQRLRKLYPRYVSEDGQLLISSQRHRALKQNRDDCIRKLRLILLDAASLPKPRRTTRPTRASSLKRRRQKQVVAQKKRLRQSPDFDD